MWIYNEKDVDEAILVDYIGFVYQITNLTNDKKYIGKKLLKSRRTKIIAGKKKKVSVDSDWKKYWGSNKFLQEDVKSLGEENFKREILRLCKSKSEANYFEGHYQFANGVLLSDNFYNQWIILKVTSAHLKNVLTE